MKFSVYTQTIMGNISAYVVSDKPNYWQDNYEIKWPYAATFPVSERFDQYLQERRAFEYCEYLNKGIVVQPPIGT